MRKIFAALIVLFGASAADAGQWVMVEHPTYMHMNYQNCTITYYKGGWYTTIPNIPCILQKTAFGIKDRVQSGVDSIGCRLHKHLCPCSTKYILRPRPHWTRYSIFHTRRYRNCVTDWLNSLTALHLTNRLRLGATISWLLYLADCLTSDESGKVSCYAFLVRIRGSSFIPQRG